MKDTDTIPIFELFGETVGLPDVLHCERIRERASEHGWNISPHRHSHMSQLILIEKGMADSVIDGESFVFKENSFLYIPAHCVHSFSFAPDTEGFVLTLPLDIVHSLGPHSEEALVTLTHVVKGHDTDDLTTLINLFSRIYKNNDLFRAQQIVALAHAMLAIVAAVGSNTFTATSDRRNNHLQQLDRLINEHLADGWRACDYANALAISTGHLSRICRTTQGVSASTYIEVATFTEAARLLAFTQMSVAEIGYKLGFSDPSYFSRRFKLTRGSTPSEYRQQFLEKE